MQTNCQFCTIFHIKPPTNTLCQKPNASQTNALATELHEIYTICTTKSVQRTQFTKANCAKSQFQTSRSVSKQDTTNVCMYEHTVYCSSWYIWRQLSSTHSNCRRNSIISYIAGWCSNCVLFGAATKYSAYSSFVRSVLSSWLWWMEEDNYLGVTHVNTNIYWTLRVVWTTHILNIECNHIWISTILKIVSSFSHINISKVVQIIKSHWRNEKGTRRT